MRTAAKRKGRGLSGEDLARLAAERAQARAEEKALAQGLEQTAVLARQRGEKVERAGGRLRITSRDGLQTLFEQGGLERPEYEAGMMYRRCYETLDAGPRSNLYRGLELLRAAAMNDLGRVLAEEGMAEVLWAGSRKRRGPAQVVIHVGLAAPGQEHAPRYEYGVIVGLPAPLAATFAWEPQIKEESLALVMRGRRTRLMERKGRSIMARDEEAGWGKIDIDLLDSETVLGRLEDSARFAELDLVRRTLLAWRFYHQVRTDAGSPLRRPCVAVATPALASDGSNLAAVFATLAHVRQDTLELDHAIEAAFPGAQLVVPSPGRNASFAMVFPEFPQRQFEAAELSDGTLRFLALAGALLAYRLPPFIALNEPEASLHPDLMEPLAGMIVKAAERSQVWLVTHSERLAEAVATLGEGKVRTVVKKDGATTIEGLKPWGEFADDALEDDDE